MRSSRKSTAPAVFIGAAVVAALAGSAPAWSQQGAESSLGLEEITVTARKVEERLQDVPLAIQVLSDERIAREGVARVEDVAKLVPGVTFDVGAFPNDTRPAIRGMVAERGRPSVAVLLDGQDLGGENLYIAGGSSSLNTRLLDLERIEVVKGPQSVLYGRAAFAGAINYISKRPDLEQWSGKVGAEVSSGATRGLTASFTGPVVRDRLAIRVNLNSFKRDGFYNNPVTGEDLGAEDSLGGALSVLFKPTDNLSLLARYQGDYARAEPLYDECRALAQQLHARAIEGDALIHLGNLARYQADYDRAAAYYDAGLALLRDVGDQPRIASVMQDQGYLAHQRGDQPGATVLLNASLARCRELVDPRLSVWCLAGLGRVAVAQGQLERAAQLFGTTAALFDLFDPRMDPTDLADYECAVAVTRGQLDAATFAAAWATGRAVTLEQVITEALQAAE